MMLCYLVIAMVMALLVTALDVRGPGSGATMGALVAAAMSAALFTSCLPTMRHRGLPLIEAAFQMITTPIAGAILGAWR